MAEQSPETAGRPVPSLEFRGFAARFQPEVAAFLHVHGPMLSGLTQVDDVERFTDCIADMRPDYLLIAEGHHMPGLLDRAQTVARARPLGVLAVGAAKRANKWSSSGLSVDAVSRHMTAFDLALVLRALMRRTRPQAMVGVSVWGDLTLDEARLTFSVRDQPVALSLEVFSVLGLMMDEPSRIWDREALHRLVFGAGSSNDLRAVDTRISRTRRHVLAALGCDPIRTVRGVGYALVPAP